MTKDLHTKRQKQIRMSDKLRQRFEKAQEKTGLTADVFVERLLDAYEGRRELSDDELLEIMKARLAAKKTQ